MRIGLAASPVLNVTKGDRCEAAMGRKRPICTPSILRRGLSCRAVDGRIPVDVSAEQTLDISAETHRVSGPDTANPATSRRNPRCSSDYAFSPTGNSADLKGTPHPPIPQYPFGFFARYCW